MTHSESLEDGKLAFFQTMLKPFSLLSKTSGLKSASSSYFALFRPLNDVQSRLILGSGILLAVAAGAPLPIIGVIFARIINSFPPSEDEIRVRICQLLAVGG